ncbi:MAG: OB-fold-containig protein [Paracoccaceae bacterium]
MTAISFLLDAGMVPFTMALALAAGLLILEVVMSLIGFSLMGDGADADFDAEIDVGLDPDSVLEIEPELEVGDPVDANGVGETAAPAGLASWLGFGEVPMILWVAGMLTAFGLSGYLVQLAAQAVIGTTLPAIAGVALAIFPALRAGRWFARTLGRLIPKTETTAINRRSLGGRVGVISQGTARRGRPAQARVLDGHGNFHFVRVEPVDDGAELTQGTEVMIRDGRGPVLFAIAID